MGRQAAKSKLAVTAVADNQISKPIKKAAEDIAKMAEAAARADTKIVKASTNVGRAYRARISQSKQVEFALRKEAASNDPLARKLVKVEERYEKAVALMRHYVRQKRQIPSILTQVANAAKKEAEELRASAAATQVASTNMKTGFGRVIPETTKSQKAQKRLNTQVRISPVVFKAAAGAAALLAASFVLVASKAAEARGASKDFGQAVAEVQTISDRSNAQISKSAQDMSIRFGGKAADQARAFYQAISEGRSRDRRRRKPVREGLVDGRRKFDPRSDDGNEFVGRV